MSSARLYHNGRVFTGRRYAEAILIDDGRVVAVGQAEEIRRLRPTGTGVEDLGGHLLLPGLIDSHLHLSRITLERESFDAGVAGSRRDLARRAQEWAALHPNGPVIGHGWHAGQFEGESEPSARDLDDGVPDRPFVIYHASGHAAVVNDPALEAMGIDRSTPDPRGGRIGRTGEGTATGVLYESALKLLDPLVAENSRVDPSGLERTLEIAASLGLTTVASMNVGIGEVRALQVLSEAHRLRLRTRLYLHLAALARPSSIDDLALPDPEHLAIRGVKAFTDGAFGPRTAWLSEPYTDAPTEIGLPAANDAELTDALGIAASRGLAPALHAIGDRAVERSLKLLRNSVGRTPAPARIEHAALTPPELFPQLREVGPALVVQPGFVWSDAWLGERLGRERARWAYAFRTLIDQGLLLAGSSDAPYDPVDPWRGLRAAVTRRDPLGRSANPDAAEALPVEGALQLYTLNAGRVLGEPELGPLEPEARADFVILDSDRLDRAFVRGSAGVIETWVGGECIAGRSGRMSANG